MVSRVGMRCLGEKHPRIESSMAIDRSQHERRASYGSIFKVDNAVLGPNCSIDVHYDRVEMSLEVMPGPAYRGGHFAAIRKRVFITLAVHAFGSNQ